MDVVNGKVVGWSTADYNGGNYFTDYGVYELGFSKIKGFIYEGKRILLDLDFSNNKVAWRFFLKTVVKDNSSNYSFGLCNGRLHVGEAAKNEKITLLY